MPATGQSSKRLYQEAEILNSDTYLKMRSESLRRQSGGELVVPVRNLTSPNFRSIERGLYGTLVGRRRENDPTHTDCIAFLLMHLQTRMLVVSTPTFSEGKREPDGQVLLSTSDEPYEWWSDESGTRIPVGDGRYIQPDLCGRRLDPSAFYATARSPNVIIEVIQKHYPEEETLLELLRLSECNYIVLLHFIKPPNFSSRYSTLDTPNGSSQMTLREVHCLIDGNVVSNGVPAGVKPPKDAAPFKLWYAGFEQNVLIPVMKKKEAVAGR